jgi:hypothetical protein
LFVVTTEALHACAGHGAMLRSYSDHMTREPRMMSKADATLTFRRAGIPTERIELALSEVSDPFDIDRDEPLIARHGVSCSYLMETMGGSP